MDQLHEKKHKGSGRTNEESKDYLVDRNAQEDEMEISDENCIMNRRAMVKERCRMESLT